jgi:hypothetical protein
MQIVLAIHPDRRQTEQIAGLARKRLGVEFLQAPSAGEGLQELGDRVPDLILTAPLLSPFDEDVIAEYLRELAGAAAHVQTLRIPVMNVPAQSGGGLFSLKRKRPESSPNGCDPSHFVNEIAEYLARAAEDRKTNPNGVRSQQPAPHASMLEEPVPEPLEPYPMQQVDTPSSYLSESYVAPAQTSEHVSTGSVDAVSSTETASVFPTYQYPDDQTGNPERDSVFPAYHVDEVELAQPSYRVDAITHSNPEPAPWRHDALAAQDSTSSLYQPPSEQVEVPQPQPDAHASLLLDPLLSDTIEEPFVVHSTVERVPLADSLERAAAQLEASALREPLPELSIERVQVDHASSLVDAPVPELSTRVATILTSLAVEPPAHTKVVVPSPSIETVSAPPAAGNEGPPRQAIENESEPLQSESVQSTRRTPSFEAALAAIRSAWGKPRPNASTSESPSPNVDRIVGEPSTSLTTAAVISSPAPTVVPDSPAPLKQGTSKAAAVETVGAHQEPAGIEGQLQAVPEIDLTRDIDTLDDANVVKPTTHEPVVVASEDLDVDVYELNAAPPLHDLEADLEAAGPPPPVRRVFPETTQQAVEPPAPVTRKRDKHRKKSDKSRPMKDQKPAAKPAVQTTQPAQDEWGLYDPNRCGFAALVDKLNEVTDEKDEKSTKASVRVVSYR